MPIFSPLDELTSKVVKMFMRAAPGARRTIVELFSDDYSFTLLGFAERMASLAVLNKSPEILTEGLAAIVLEEGKFDIREDITVMAPLYDAELKIGADPETLFTQAADLAPNEVSDVLRTFPSRPDESKSLICMQFVESEDQDGLLYERVW